MVVLDFYPDPNSGGTTVDGEAGRASVDETLATIIAGAGTFSNMNGAGIDIELDASATTNQYALLFRGILTFDTSALGSGATISGATLNLYVNTAKDDFGSQSFNIVGATPANNNNVVNADYSQLGTTKFSSDIAFSGISTAQYLVITLNAAGLAAISKTGITALGLRLTCDNLGGSVVWQASPKYCDLNFKTADLNQQKPYLEVTYTPGGQTISVSESQSFSESFKGNMDIKKTESVSFSETISVLRGIVLSFSESMGFTELINIVWNMWHKRTPPSSTNYTKRTPPTTNWTKRT